MIYRTHGLFLTLLLVLFLVIVVGVLPLDLLATAFTKIGFTWGEALLLLSVALVGSSVNIPLFILRPRVPVITLESVRMFGLVYRIPLQFVAESSTVIAVNVGGAVIPVLVSLYLLVRFEDVFLVMIATIIVAAGVHVVARPVEGVGIVVPALFPPVAAAFVTLLLSASTHASAEARFVTAYVSGTVGTLVGADLLNLGRIKDSGAPVASIGGAGTFDGVFLAGLFAVLLV